MGEPTIVEVKIVMEDTEAKVKPRKKNENKNKKENLRKSNREQVGGAGL